MDWRHIRWIYRGARRNRPHRMAVGSLHEKAIEFFVANFNISQPLDPVIARPSRSHHPQRKSVRGRERLTVHLEGKQGIGMNSFCKWDGAHEIRHGPNGYVGAVEQHLSGTLVV